MKKLLATVVILFLTTTTFAAELNNWWGVVSFRERLETAESYFSNPGSDNFGKSYQTITNAKTRLGYQFGFDISLSEYLHAGVSFRTGMQSVMLQDIDNRGGLAPGLEQAFLDWRTPFMQVLLGKFHQDGTALWDTYTAHTQTDFRADDPRDGIFADRLSSLNGVKLIVPVGPVTLRGLYHTDYVTGKKIETHTGADEGNYNPDLYVYILGADVSAGDFVANYINLDNFNLDIGLDYGIPSRTTNHNRLKDFQVDLDKTSYFDESLWGVNIKTGIPWAQLQFGYAYNWVDSVYTSRFWDYKLTMGLPVGVVPEWIEDLTLTARYQYHSQEHEFGIYDGTSTIRDAVHIYLDKKVWDLNIQPRIIWFNTDIEGIKTNSNVRIELTTTARFNL
jgi:hypothetical protein